MMTLELCLLVEAVQLLEISFWLGLTESMYNLSGKKKKTQISHSFSSAAKCGWAVTCSFITTEIPIFSFRGWQFRIEIPLGFDSLSL